MLLRAKLIENHVRGSRILVGGGDDCHIWKVVVDLNGNCLFHAGGCALARELDPLPERSKFTVGIANLRRTR